uniref:Uncharacterized protein n=1 Tax=Arundo donax TaxID=35708 RepID=A0A0A9HFS7_ARUDO
MPNDKTRPVQISKA